MKAKATSKETSAEADIRSAERVLRLEADGLRALARSLDGSFGEAIDTLVAVKGRTVVTGMGKSGHVARKIAATFSSVGTPALYVHPAEASHGDLGMITSSDALLALSSSGETAELSNLLAYTRRFSIPLIAITREAGSALAEAADITLLLPASPEACPLGLAPTTSTTMMMALGDAMAVALLERKGFSTDDFHVLHPGGQLGRKLLRVADIMHTGDELPLLGPNASMADALLTMTAKRFGCVGVVEGGRLIGIITDGDLRRHLGDDFLARTAREVMTPRPKTIRPQALASEALGLMNARTITNLFVVDANVPVGIVHIHDCLRMGVA
ncbi:MAG: KpsF/GutQ family sugar-phosphate isomerase [Alphaproteobacteria bacterium]